MLPGWVNARQEFDSRAADKILIGDRVARMGFVCVFNPEGPGPACPGIVDQFEEMGWNPDLVWA